MNVMLRGVQSLFYLNDVKALARNRNVPLDAFRGLFATLVAMGHFFLWTGADPKFPTTFVLAVDFFFVLSGFVLVKSIVESQSTLEDWARKFFAKRFWRIYPLYLFTTLATALVFVLAGRSTDLNTFRMFELLILGQVTGISTGGAFLIDSAPGIAWSLSAEIWVGFLFFPLVFLLRKSKTVMAIVCALGSILLLNLLLKSSPKFMDEHYQAVNEYVTFASVRCLFGFFVGFIVYYFSNLRMTRLQSSMAQVASIVLIAVVFGNQGRNHIIDYTAPCFSGLLVFSFIQKNGILFIALDNFICELVGRLSYAVYLCHPIVIALIKLSNLQFLRNPAAYLVCIYAFSYLANVLVERRFMKSSSGYKTKPARIAEPALSA